MEEFYPGFRFRERHITRTREYQESRLAACGLDPALYGDQAAAGLFGQDCFKAMREAAHQIDGYVHVEQRFRQTEPIAIGEPLTQRGWIEAYDEVARGHLLHRTFEFVRNNGSVAVVADVIGLVPDAEKWSAARKSVGKSEAVDPKEGFAPVQDKTMTPDDVTLFSSDVGNLIHFDIHFAQRLGYRAPLAQGLQTMVWMMGQLTEDGPPMSFDVSAKFKRPVFWDDRMSLWSRSGKNGFIEELRALNAAGKVTSDLMVREMSYS